MKVAVAVTDDPTFADAGGDTNSPAAGACSVTAGTSTDSGTSPSAATAAMVVVDSNTPGISSAVKS